MEHSLRIGIDARAAEEATDGIGRYARELLRAFSVRDDGAQFFVLKGSERGASYAFDSRFTEIIVPAERFGLREQWVLPRLLARLRLDLFHSMHAALPLGYRGVQVMTVHDIFPILIPWSFGRNGLKNSAAAAYYAALVRLSLRRASLTIVDSEHTGKDLGARFRCDMRRVRRIYLGIDHIRSAPGGGDPGALERYGIRRPYLITVTNFKPHKNTGRVIEAFRIVRETMPEMTLAVVGNDPRGFAKGLGRPGQLEAENVRLLGYVGDGSLMTLLTSAEVFVFPSLYEGFGFPVLEAMARGTPVVTSAVTSIPEVGGDAVIYSDPDDPRSIADAILTVCADGGYREDLRRRGLNQAGKFRWQDAAAQTFGVYREAMQIARGSVE